MGFGLGVGLVEGTIVSPNGTGCASVAFASAGLLFWSGTNGNWREAQPSLLRCASSGLLFLISFWWLVGCDERTENVQGSAEVVLHMQQLCSHAVPESEQPIPRRARVENLKIMLFPQDLY